MGRTIGVPAPQGVWNEAAAIQLFHVFFNTSAEPLIAVDEFSKMVDIITDSDAQDKPGHYSSLVNGFGSYFAVYSGFTRASTKQFATSSGRSASIMLLPPASKADQRLRMLPQLALLKSRAADLKDFALHSIQLGADQQLPWLGGIRG